MRTPVSRYSSGALQIKHSSFISYPSKPRVYRSIFSIGFLLASSSCSPLSDIDEKAFTLCNSSAFSDNDPSTNELNALDAG
jgi:hypothetical protein